MQSKEKFVSNNSARDALYDKSSAVAEMAAQSCITCCLLNNNQVALSDEWKGKNITELNYVARPRRWGGSVLGKTWGEARVHGHI